MLPERSRFFFFLSHLFRPIRGPCARHDGKPSSKATRDTLRKSKAGKIPGRKKSRAHGEARRGSRLASGGAEKVSARTSLRPSAAPSTLAAFPSGRERRLAATARAAANESKADQWETYGSERASGRIGLPLSSTGHRARCQGRRGDNRLLAAGVGPLLCLVLKGSKGSAPPGTAHEDRDVTICLWAERFTGHIVQLVLSIWFLYAEVSQVRACSKTAQFRLPGS